jgi:asparagine synthase (glutamine-hydrolysing)
MIKTTPVRVQTTGTPTFNAPHLAQLASSFGPGLAWRAANYETGIAAAAAATAGAFSVGLTTPDGRATLAVDRFAIHTLCYRVVDGKLRFAPRADALADVHTEIDPQAIFDYLFFHTIPSPRTIYKGIYRLPPAHYAEFEQGQVKVTPYWVPSFIESNKRSFKDLRSEFLDLLRQSVSDQLDGSKPACFLSGGTDSSTVAGMIGSVSGQAAATYSIGFDAAGYDEMEYARLAARHFGTEHHEYYVTPEDLVRSIPDVASHYDQPFGNSSALPAYYCAAMARADGVSRLLAGDGGDELFGGNSRYAHQRVLGWYGALPAMMRANVMEPALGNATARSMPLVRKAASYVDQARVAMPERLNLYNLLNRLGMEVVFERDFLQRVNPAAATTQQWQTWHQACTDSPLQRNLAFDWRYTLAENDLPKVCGTAALAGLGVGFPLLDQRLLDFSLRLPAAYKLKGLRLRWFFKEALRGFLPDPILKKKKQGFGLPFGLWVCQHAGLRHLASDSLKGLGERGIVRRDFIDTLLEQHLPKHPGYYGEMVWLLMVLEQWLRAHAPNYRAGSATA